MLARFKTWIDSWYFAVYCYRVDRILARDYHANASHVQTRWLRTRFSMKYSPQSTADLIAFWLKMTRPVSNTTIDSPGDSLS